MPKQRHHRPNILFIHSDQHRADVWSRHRPEISTPHLARLAAEGLTCEHAYTVAQPCVPARASLLTGRYAELHRTWSNYERLPSCETTWGDVLDLHGYQTLAVGRTHHIDKGFEPVRVPYGNSFPMIDYTRVHEIPWGPDGFISRSPVGLEDFYEMRVARTAVDLMEDMRRNQPFAMCVGFVAPHPPFVMPEPFFSLYRPEAMQLLPEAPPPRSPRLDDWVKRWFGEHLTEQRQRELQAAYFGMVSLLDACIGRLLKGLEEHGLLENTLVIYTSDHGEQMGHRGLWNKCYGYDPSMRVPLLLRQPGKIPAARSTDAFIESVDLFSTILEAAGVPAEAVPPGRSGRSFWPVATGAATVHRDWVYGASGRSGCIYRDREWKFWYEVGVGGVEVTEFYHLHSDPGEQVNRFADPACAPARDRILRTLFNHSITHLQESISVTEPNARQGASFNAQFKV